MLFALLLAQAEAPAQEGPPWWVQMLPLFFIVLIGYFLLLRPMQRQEQQRRALVSAVKKNDKIVNVGGIIGVVESIKEKEDEVILRGGLRITKSSIVRIIPPDEPVKEQS